MTIAKENTPAPIAEENENAGYLRAYAVPKVLGLYGTIKDYNPYLKSSLETVETRILQPVERRIPEQWKDTATAASDNFDTMLTRNIDERVLAPIHSNIEVARERVVNPLTETVNARFVSPANKVRQMSLEEVRGAAMQKVGEGAVYWKDLRGDLTKKAAHRLERGLSRACEFSATRGKDILHVDLIAYSKTVLDNAQVVAQQNYEPAVELLARSVERVDQTRRALQTYVGDKAGPLTETARAELLEKLHKAMHAARHLSSSSVLFVQNQYRDLQDKLPAEYRAAALHDKLPARMQAAVAFILSSPDLFNEVVGEASKDVAYSKGVLNNIQSLLAALNTVYRHHQDAPIPTPTAEGEVARHQLPAQEPIEGPEDISEADSEVDDSDEGDEETADEEEEEDC